MLPRRCAGASVSDESVSKSYAETNAIVFTGYFVKLYGIAYLIGFIIKASDFIVGAAPAAFHEE